MHSSRRPEPPWYEGVPQPNARWSVGESDQSLSRHGGTAVGMYVRVACRVSSPALGGVTLHAEGEAYVPRRIFDAFVTDGAAQLIATHINMTVLRVHARGARLPPAR